MPRRSDPNVVRDDIEGVGREARRRLVIPSRLQIARNLVFFARRLHVDPSWTNVGKKTFYVYILASRSGVLYVGVTSDLRARLRQHIRGPKGAFTARYRTRKLVYCETYAWIRDAIQREKQLKGWRRAKKRALVDSVNPSWRDLANELAH